MSQKTNHFRIGLFVLAGVALLVGSIVLLGADALRDKGVILETYLDESVQGLDVGSPLKYRGVQVGNVREISFVGDTYPEAKPEYRRYILVRANLEKHMIRAAADDASLRDLLERQIAEGLRVRLASQGITGLAYLEVDYVDPKRSAPLPINWKPKVKYVPSAQSRLTVIGESLERVAVGLHDANLPEIAGNIRQLIATVEGTVSGLELEKLVQESTLLMTEARETNSEVKAFLTSEEIDKLSADAAATASSARALVDESREDVRETVRTIRESSEQLREVSARARAIVEGEEMRRAMADFQATGASARQASERLPATLESADRTLRRLEVMLSSQQNDIRLIMENLRRVSDNLRDLSEDTRRYPSNAILGRQPRPSEVNR